MDTFGEPLSLTVDARRVRKHRFCVPGWRVPPRRRTTAGSPPAALPIRGGAPRRSRPRQEAVRRGDPGRFRRRHTRARGAPRRHRPHAPMVNDRRAPPVRGVRRGHRGHRHVRRTGVRRASCRRPPTDRRASSPVRGPGARVRESDKHPSWSAILRTTGTQNPASRSTKRQEDRSWRTPDPCFDPLSGPVSPCAVLLRPLRRPHLPCGPATPGARSRRRTRTQPPRSVISPRRRRRADDRGRPPCVPARVPGLRRAGTATRA